jgi:ankyrin repeat protein
MASSLPDSPSLDKLRSEAKRLQRLARAGDDGARQFVSAWHPRPDRVDLALMPLHDAQLATARRYGFVGWPALVAYVDTARPLSTDPATVVEDALAPADAFCALACLQYDERDEPARRERAAAMLHDDPELPAASVWAAAAASDPSALRRHLADDPTLAGRKGGPYDWEPLLYLCYSRVPTSRRAEGAVEAARLLLAAGADPDAGFLWRGLATPFTALTGVFGEGEQGPHRQPRHPHDVLLAVLLLERGAEANDGQTLYNRMFTPGTEHLEVLFRFGLGGPDRGPWRRRLGDAMETPAEMLDRQVRWAAEHGFADRLELFARHGVDVSGVRLRDARALPDDVNAKTDGRTPLHEAAWDGDLERIEALLAAGADLTVTDDVHGGTPLDWAEHAYQEEAAALLRRHTPGAGDPSA